MTVTYTQKVSDCKGFGSFWRLLFRWRGSLYKLVWPDTLVYSLLYFICSIVYRFALDEEQRRVFEHLSLYCDYFRNLIPISFVLGFYVTVVVQRWWEQYLTIPWPDDFALLCTAYIRGRSGAGRAIRATMLRYVNLTCVLTFAKISPKVHKKFPSYKEMLEAGYLTPHEKHILEKQGTLTSVSLATLPLMWSCRVVESARSSRYISDDFGPKMLVQELVKLRDKAGMLLRWTDLSIPLVYTQVVTMAVYSFFLFSVLGRQFLDPAQNYNNRTIDFFVPIFTLLQFFFYMGWLKVAESLVNPFGEDDDDFDLDLILERHFKMSYLLGDVTPSEDPLDLDEFSWDKFCPGSYTGPGSDLGLGLDLGHMADLGRMADLGSGDYMIDHGRGDLGRGDLGRGDLGRGDLGRGDLSRGDLGRGDLGRTTPDPDTVILSPDLPHRDHFDFIWEQMDLSVPQDPVRSQPTTTPTTLHVGTTYSTLQRDPSGRTDDEEGHGSQGHGNQGHGSQGHGSQGHGNQGHGSQGHGSQGHGSRGHGNQGHGSQGHGNQGHGNQGHGSQGNQDHGNKSQGNQGHGNQGHGNQDHGNQGRGNQDHSSQGNQGHGNQGHGNQGHISSRPTNLGLISPSLTNLGQISPGHTNSGHISPGHTNSGHISPGHTNSGHISPGHTNSGHISPGHTNSGHPSPGHSSLGYPTSGYSSLGHPSLGHTNQGHPSPGHSTLGHPSPGHKNKQRTSNIREINDSTDGVVNPSFMD